MDKDGGAFTKLEVTLGKSQTRCTPTILRTVLYSRSIVQRIRRYSTYLRNRAPKTELARNPRADEASGPTARLITVGAPGGCGQSPPASQNQPDDVAVDGR